MENSPTSASDTAGYHCACSVWSGSHKQHTWNLIWLLYSHERILLVFQQHRDEGFIEYLKHFMLGALLSRHRSIKPVYFCDLYKVIIRLSNLADYRMVLLDPSTQPNIILKIITFIIYGSSRSRSNTLTAEPRIGLLPEATNSPPHPTPPHPNKQVEWKPSGWLTEQLDTHSSGGRSHAAKHCSSIISVREAFAMGKNKQKKVV